MTPKGYFEYGYNFTISCGDASNVVTLKMGNNVMNRNYKVFLENMTTYASGICYRINPLRTKEIKEVNAYGTTEISLNFHENIPDDDLPPISLFFTSAKNSYGIIFNEWKDGNVPWIILDKVSSERYVQYFLMNILYLGSMV